MWNPLNLFKSNTDNLLSASDKQQLVQAIQAAEKNTSGEIRVFVETSIPKKQDALQRATAMVYWFMLLYRIRNWPFTVINKFMKK